MIVDDFFCPKYQVNLINHLGKILLPWMARNSARCRIRMYDEITVLDQKQYFFSSHFYIQSGAFVTFCKSCLQVLPAFRLIWLGQNLRSGICFSFFPPTRKVNICTCCCRPEKMRTEEEEEDGTILQGDTSACSEGFVDIKIKVAF